LEPLGTALLPRGLRSSRRSCIGELLPGWEEIWHHVSIEKPGNTFKKIKSSEYYWDLPFYFLLYRSNFDERFKDHERWLSLP